MSHFGADNEFVLAYDKAARLRPASAHRSKSNMVDRTPCTVTATAATAAEYELQRETIATAAAMDASTMGRKRSSRSALARKATDQVSYALSDNEERENKRNNEVVNPSSQQPRKRAHLVEQARK